MDVDEIDTQGVADLQSDLRTILTAVVELAEEGGFPLFAAYGTALGAVREGGLIPWDRDVDLWVPTESYEALRLYLAEHLPPSLEVLDPQSRRDYEYLFARVSRKGVDHKLLHVDLFPLAGAPSTRPAQRLYSLASRTLVQAFLMKRVRLDEKHHYSPSKRLVARIAKVLVTPVPDDALMRAYRALVARYDRPGAEVLTNPVGAYRLREFWDADCFSTTVSVELSGVDVPTPGGYDSLLTLMYGDYLKPIDESAQRAELVHATRYYVVPLREQGWVPLGPTGP